MEPPTKPRRLPTRALGGVAFACFSFWFMLVDIGDSTGGLQNALESAKLDWVRENLTRREGLLHIHLAIGYTSLALAALICCILSWRTEAGLGVGIAVLLTALALAVSLLSLL